ncbi:MAG TPA: helix-turn-helix domain-containing protein [Candidatus Kapabacteria bacterium]|nr:helix-turn-helix domain-containing protein [Candidatus Kapabacteria bacterium]
MDWTPENIYLLRRHIGDTQGQFAERVGLKRRQTVSDWEVGKIIPGGITRKLLDVIANDHGFTERVAARLREKLKRDEGE